jgi:hypothetical protein
VDLLRNRDRPQQPLSRPRSLVGRRRGAYPHVVIRQEFHTDLMATPSHAAKKGTRYRYYVSRPLITKDQTQKYKGSASP